MPGLVVAQKRQNAVMKMEPNYAIMQFPAVIQLLENETSRRNFNSCVLML